MTSRVDPRCQHLPKRKCRVTTCRRLIRKDEDEDYKDKEVEYTEDNEDEDYEDKKVEDYEDKADEDYEDKADEDYEDKEVEDYEDKEEPDKEGGRPLCVSLLPVNCTASDSRLHCAVCLDIICYSNILETLIQDVPKKRTFRML